MSDAQEMSALCLDSGPGTWLSLNETCGLVLDATMALERSDNSQGPLWLPRKHTRVSNTPRDSMRYGQASLE